MDAILLLLRLHPLMPLFLTSAMLKSKPAQNN
jgi:hypothetical protein